MSSDGVADVKPTLELDVDALETVVVTFASASNFRTVVYTRDENGELREGTPDRAEPAWFEPYPLDDCPR